MALAGSVIVCRTDGCVVVLLFLLLFSSLDFLYMWHRSVGWLAFVCAVGCASQSSNARFHGICCTIERFFCIGGRYVLNGEEVEG